jgi:hypothetical protein
MTLSSEPRLWKRDAPREDEVGIKIEDTLWNVDDI